MPSGIIPTMDAQLELNKLSVCLEGTPIIHDVTCRVGEGDIACLLGPSGCGKTTILRAIAGFETPSSGSIHIRGIETATAKKQVDATKRKVGMVFQDLALFPHMTVRKNVAFGMNSQNSKACKARVDELLELVALTKYADSYPHQLSGGQQQRVALIRAMAPRPPVLLLDEPFSSQDTDLRVQLAHEVREILKHDGITAILVTHDQYEAFAIADNIGVIEDGRLLQWDNAFDLYHKPRNRFVADFIGEGVFVCGATMANNEIQTDFGIIKGDVSNKFDVGTQIELLVRPDDIVHDESSNVAATVIAKDFRGADHLYTLRMPGNTRLLSLAPSHHNHSVGEKVGVRLQLDHLMVFKREDF